MTYLGAKERQALRVLLGLDPAGTAEKQAAQKALLPLLTPPTPTEPEGPHALDVSVGEYRVVQNVLGETAAYRNGEIWRSLTGDELVSALANRVEELERREDKLDALEEAGVDNWEGYSHAMQILRGYGSGK